MGSQYKQEVSKFGKKDGIIALCIYAWVVLYHTPGVPIASWWLGVVGGFGLHVVLANFIATFTVFVLPCIVITIIGKRGFASMGFNLKNLWAALRLGLVFSAITLVLFGNIFHGIVQGWELLSFAAIISGLLLTLVFAAWEDIVLMGFIQPRIYGLIKKDVLAVLAVALMFAFMHIPPWLHSGQFAPADIFSWLIFVGWVGNFIAWNMIFRRYFSIWPVIMLHTIMNFAPEGIWAVRGQGLDFNVASVVLWILIYGWAWVVYRRDHKKSIE